MATAVCVTGTLPTSGTVDLTSTGFGTPDAALVFCSAAHSSANPEALAILAVGFVTASAQNGFAVKSQHGTASSNTSRSCDTENVLPIPSGLADSVLVTHAATLITDGIRFSIASGSTINARQVQVVLFKNLKSVACGTTATNGTTAVSISTGFKPTAIFGGNVGLTSTGSASTAYLSFGVAHNNAANSLVQHSINWSHPDGKAVATVNQSNNDNCICRRYFDDGAGLNDRLSAQNLTSSGFEAVWNTGSSTSLLHWLAIELNDPDEFYAATVTAATGTAPYTQDFTGPGFEPICVGFATARSTTVNNTESAPSGSLSIGVASGAGAQACVVIGDQDAAATMNTYSRWDGANVLNLRTNADAQTAVAAFDSWLSTGVRLNWTDDSPDAYQMLMWALGADAAGAPPTLTGISASGITSSGATLTITAS